jgi:hypothetical protein
LKALYIKRVGNPVNLGIPEQASPAEAAEKIKKRLMESYKVEESELRRLAEERAAIVRERLLSSEGVLPEQVFLLDAKLDQTGSAGLVSTKLALAPK